LQLRYDLHVHTVRSRDAHTKLEWIPHIIKLKQLNGLAITDHDRIPPPHISGVNLIPGIEVSTKDGHVIGLGIVEGIERGLSADETIERIHSQNGIAIVPHPHDPVSSRVKIAGLRQRPDAVETVNSDALIFSYNSWRSTRDAERLGLPTVAGSDSHVPATIGDAYTILDADSDELNAVLSAIREGKVTPVGKASKLADKFSKYNGRLLRKRAAAFGLDP
jgi:hypothetical protein